MICAREQLLKKWMASFAFQELCAHMYMYMYTRYTFFSISLDCVITPNGDLRDSRLSIRHFFFFIFFAFPCFPHFFTHSSFPLCLATDSKENRIEAYMYTHARTAVADSFFRMLSV